MTEFDRKWASFGIHIAVISIFIRCIGDFLIYSDTYIRIYLGLAILGWAIILYELFTGKIKIRIG